VTPGPAQVECQSFQSGLNLGLCVRRHRLSPVGRAGAVVLVLPRRHNPIARIGGSGTDPYQRRLSRVGIDNKERLIKVKAV
jgi:hypothetical protein